MKLHVIALFLLCILPTYASAKRTVAPKVEAVAYNGIQFIAPNDNGRREYIQAFDIESGKLIEEITVHNNIIWFWIEEDNQWYYITNIKIENDNIIVTDEKDRVFKLESINKTKEK